MSRRKLPPFFVVYGFDDMFKLFIALSLQSRSIAHYISLSVPADYLTAQSYIKGNVEAVYGSSSESSNNLHESSSAILGYCYNIMAEKPSDGVVIAPAAEKVENSFCLVGSSCDAYDIRKLKWTVLKAICHQK
jgi:hypothetical protein